MKTQTLRAYAKINIGLDITGKREDGYHLLKSCMQTINLYDEITVTRDAPDQEKEIKITSSLSELPVDKRNIAFRAADLIKKEYSLKNKIHIDIKKNIPMEAGLAGGSTNAAAVLKAMNELFCLKIGPDKMDELAAVLGADVPFCLRKGLWLCEGIGEVLTQLPALCGLYAVIVKPAFSISTKWCYAEFDKLASPKHPDMYELLLAIKRGDNLRVCQVMGNVLEDVSCPAHPEIEEIKREMIRQGALGACMSGSGSTTFGLFEDENSAKEAADFFKNLSYTENCFVTEFIYQENLG